MFAWSGLGEKINCDEAIDFWVQRVWLPVQGKVWSTVPVSSRLSRGRPMAKSSSKMGERVTGEANQPVEKGTQHRTSVTGQPRRQQNESDRQEGVTNRGEEEDAG